MVTHSLHSGGRSVRAFSAVFFFSFSFSHSHSFLHYYYTASWWLLLLLFNEIFLRHVFHLALVFILFSFIWFSFMCVWSVSFSTRIFFAVFFINLFPCSIAGSRNINCGCTGRWVVWNISKMLTLNFHVAIFFLLATPIFFFVLFFPFIANFFSFTRLALNS